MSHPLTDFLFTDDAVSGGIRSWIATGRKGLLPLKLLIKFT